MIGSILKRTADFISKVVIENIPLFMMMGFISLFQHSEFFEFLHIKLMPVLLSYTAGKSMEKKYGGISAVLVMGAFLAEYKVMTLLEPILIGAVAGFLIKEYIKWTEKYKKIGYEMLIDNSGIVIICTVAVFITQLLTPIYIKVQSLFMDRVIEKLVGIGYLSFYAMIIEPAKVLFLNNLINHGIFSVLGMAEFAEKGKSVFFLLETNPGPGLGLLLAFFYYKKKNKEILSNIFIHFIGGIHEVYFPYVLRNIYMIIPLIISGMFGIISFSIFNLGLTGIASPGSIVMILLLAPVKEKLLILIVVLLSSFVSFLGSLFILRIQEKSILNAKIDKKVEEKIIVIEKEDNIVEKNKNEDIKKENKINNISVVCDAGMGSSAMGATFLRRKLEKAGLKKIKVSNLSIDNSDIYDADIIIIHKHLVDRLGEKTAAIRKILVDDFLNSTPYDELVSELKETYGIIEEKLKIVDYKNIKLNLTKVNKQEALINLGLDLYKGNYVEKKYVESILKREEKSTTYLENGIAIPHGTSGGKKYINHTGLVLHQYPYGIDFEDGNKVYVLIGIAFKGNECSDLISQITEIVKNENLAETLAMAVEVDEVCRILNLEGTKC